MHKEWLAAPLLFLASALILSLVFLQYNFSGKWLSGAEALNWGGDALTLSKGQGYSGKDKLVIEGLEGEVAVASLSMPSFRAEDFAFVRWTITGMTPGVEMEFLWRTAENRVFKRPLVWTGDTATPLQMAQDKNWRRQIIGLALVVKGRLAAPITIKGVSLLSARAALLIMLKRWFVLDRWQGTSINFMDGDAVEQDIAPVPAIAAIILLALALYWGLAKFVQVTDIPKAVAGITAPSPQPSGPRPEEAVPSPRLRGYRRIGALSEGRGEGEKPQALSRISINVAVVLGVVFLGWFALDIRWQTNLLRQLDLTRQQFAGKSWEGKHLAAEDGALFDFMQQAKAKLPAASGRILYFSDDNFLRGRGAYHLYPRNVLASNDLPKAAQFRAGDTIVLYAKKSVKYYPARQVLAWDDQSLPVETLMLAAGNAVFRVP
jgi:hypothetical protein